MKRAALLVFAGLAALLLVGLWTQRDAPLAGTGWVAKRVCSAVFVAGRAPDSLAEATLPLPLPFPIPVEIDRAGARVTAKFFGRSAPSVARWRSGLGCTLDDPDGRPSPLDRVDWTRPTPAERPLAHAPPSPALEGVLASAFADARDGFGTRAVVVLADGALAGERYADGFDAETPLPGWSMTKSVTNALVGMLVDAGRIDLDRPVGLADWAVDDPRAAITWDELLRMSSGLAFEELYFLPSADAIQMLFGGDRRNRGRYAATRRLAHPRDTHFSYSSGTTNLLQYAMRRRVFGDDLAAYLRFPHEALFAPLGMKSAVLEPDASGVYVGSSHMFATARDWARFGRLFLDRGRVGERRLLSEAWIDYSTTPTPTNARGRYGAHWWLNADPESTTEPRRWPDLPSDLFLASGFEGQYVVVLPSDGLVIVRLGVDRGARFDIGAFSARVRAVLRGSGA